MNYQQMPYIQLAALRNKLRLQIQWGEAAYAKTDIDNLALLVWQFNKLFDLRESLIAVDKELTARKAAYKRQVPLSLLMAHIGFATSYNPDVEGGKHGGGNSPTLILFNDVNAQP